MPSATLHLTHIELLAKDPQLPQPLRAALQKEITYARFGSVLCDLPFYTNIWTMMVGYWLEMPAEKCPFAQMIHRCHPDLFAWHLLKEAAQAKLLNREQRLAVMTGFFSHVALDLEIHPLVNWTARRDVMSFGGAETHHHRLAEKYHSLFFHMDLFGEDIVGSTRLFTEKARIVEYATFFKRETKHPLVYWITDLLSSFYHEAAPSRRQLAGWIRSFRHFGLCLSLPMAKENSQRWGNATNRKLYYENDDFSFMEFWQRGYDRSLELINLAYHFWTTDNWSSEMQKLFLKQANIGNLAEPEECNLPLFPQSRDLGYQLGLAS